MEQKFCSLCGGLIVDHRCRGCGMYYRSTDGTYYLNVQRPEDAKAGKQKQEDSDRRTSWKPEPVRQKKMTQQRGQTVQTVQTGQSRPLDSVSRQTDTGTVRKRNPAFNRKRVLITALSIGFVAFSIFMELHEDDLNEDTDVFGWNSDSSDDEDTMTDSGLYNDDVDYDSYAEEEEADVYKNVTRELSETGDAFDIALEPGYYIVGQQIPEGNYTVSTNSILAQMSVTDLENDIHYTWYASEVDQEDKTDIRLYTGARIRITGLGELMLSTANGQVDAMEEAVQNPLTESFNAKEEQLNEGSDYAAGWYDVQVLEGEGFLNVYRLSGTSGSEEDYEITDSIFLAKESSYESDRFCNLYLEKGSGIVIENYAEDGEPCRMKLTPSEEIYGGE